MKYQILFAILFILSACSGGYDPRLSKIKDIVSDSPKEALAALDSINYESLSESDRHMYDFLSIKAKDKAYICHTSDSLILDVINWYKSRPAYHLYPEALYYGGRVYSDLGDKPSALRYFQHSLDQLPQNTENQRLRASVLNQIGNLLGSLRLYKEAIPYIKKSIEIDRCLNDSINEVYDLHLLGVTELRDSNYNDAEKYFKSAYEKSYKISRELFYMSKIYLSAVKYYKGSLIRLFYLLGTLQIL